MLLFNIFSENLSMIFLLFDIIYSRLAEHICLRISFKCLGLTLHKQIRCSSPKIKVAALAKLFYHNICQTSVLFFAFKRRCLEKEREDTSLMSVHFSFLAI